MGQELSQFTCSDCDGEDGLVNAKTIPKNPPNQTPPEVAEKVLHLRRKYHLGPERLPRVTRLRKGHTKRYNKQVPGHHIQMDVKFLTFIGKKGEKIRRFQYTAIDDATRVRALKVYKKHTQANAIDFVDHIIDKFPFRIREIRTDNVLCWEAAARNSQQVSLRRVRSALDNF